MGVTEKRLLDIIKKNGTICFTLIDSEDVSQKQIINIIKKIEKAGVHGILIGGSTVTDQKQLDTITKTIKSVTSLPVILFPGNITGISYNADAILFSSLLNSSNPYFIIQAQVLSAPIIKKYNLEAIPMGYIVIGNGGTIGYIGNAIGIPSEKGDIAAMYALAAQYMGMRVIYLEAGSGVSHPVPPSLIKKVRKLFNGILIVGGGIRSKEVAKEISDAGADIIIVGTLIEKKGFEIKLKDIIDTIKQE